LSAALERRIIRSTSSALRPKDEHHKFEREDSSWEQPIGAWAAKRKGEPFTVGDVLREAMLMTDASRHTRVDQMRVGAALRKFGYKSRPGSGSGETLSDAGRRRASEQDIANLQPASLTTHLESAGVVVTPPRR